MAILSDASTGDVFELMETRPLLTVLFVDESELCNKYISLPWVAEEAEVFTLDESMAEIFQVGKVPQYRFYLEGSEISNIVGTCNRETILEYKQKVFGNVRTLKPRG